MVPLSGFFVKFNLPAQPLVDYLLTIQSELSLFDFKDYRRPPCTLNMTDFENPCSNDYAFQHRYLLLSHQLLNCNIKFADKISDVSYCFLDGGSFW